MSICFYFKYQVPGTQKSLTNWNVESTIDDQRSLEQRDDKILTACTVSGIGRIVEMLHFSGEYGTYNRLRTMLQSPIIGALIMQATTIRSNRPSLTHNTCFCGLRR